MLTWGQGQGLLMVTLKIRIMHAWAHTHPSSLFAWEAVVRLVYGAIKQAETLQNCATKWTRFLFLFCRF